MTIEIIEEDKIRQDQVDKYSEKISSFFSSIAKDVLEEKEDLRDYFSLEDLHNLLVMHSSFDMLLHKISTTSTTLTQAVKEVLDRVFYTSTQIESLLETSYADDMMIEDAVELKDNQEQ